MSDDTNLPPEITDLPVAYSSGVGALMVNTQLLAQIEVIAEKMASAKCTVPKHFANSPGDCYAVVMQAVQWGMNPFAVAQKTHLVHGTLGYEAQLVNAAITSLAPTKDRLNYEWFGDWNRILGKFKTIPGKEGKSDYQVPDWNRADEEGLGVRVRATFKGENEPRVLELLLKQALVRNSTLWAADPRQQLAYLASKRWARLHCPDVILGVYSPDELSEIVPPGEREVRPPADTAPADPVAYPIELFRDNLPKWRALIEAGKKTPADIIAVVQSKGALTEEQKLLIMDCVPLEADVEVVS